MSGTGSAAFSEFQDRKPAEILSKTAENVQRLERAVDGRGYFLEKMINDRQNQMFILNKNNEELKSEVKKLRLELVEQSANTSKYEEEVIYLRTVIKDNMPTGYEVNMREGVTARQACTDSGSQCSLPCHIQEPFDSKCTQSVLLSSVISYYPEVASTEVSELEERKAEIAERKAEIAEMKPSDVNDADNRSLDDNVSEIHISNKESEGNCIEELNNIDDKNSQGQESSPENNRLVELTNGQKDTVGDMSITDAKLLLEEERSKLMTTVAALESELAVCIEVAECSLCEVNALLQVFDALYSANQTQESEVKELEQRLVVCERNTSHTENKLHTSKKEFEEHIRHKKHEACEKATSIEMSLRTALHGISKMELEIIKYQDHFEDVCGVLKLENSNLITNIKKKETEIAALKDRLLYLKDNMNTRETLSTSTFVQERRDTYPNIGLIGIFCRRLSSFNVFARAHAERGNERTGVLSADNKKVDVYLYFLRELLGKIVEDVKDDGHIAPLVLTGLTLSALVARWQ